MKTAEEWRTWYYTTHGRTVTPASMLDDILRDLEALEAETRSLKAIIARQEGVEIDVL